LSPLSREPVILAYYPRELTISVNPARLRRQLFLVSHGTKKEHGK
jgi:hypothetical protein